MIVLAAGAIGGIVYAWLPKPIAVDAAPVARGPLDVTVDDDGRTRVRDRFVVAAPVGGELGRIELDPGTVVTAGQAIGRIYPPASAILDARNRDDARAQLAAAIAHQRQATTAAAAAEAARAVAARNAERARALFAGGAISATERERAELASTQADADAATADAQRAAAAAEVRGARAVVTGGTRDGGSVPIVAPVEGRVLRVIRDSAGPIATGAPIVELGDPNALEVVVDVLSIDAARIAVGAPATITGWGGDRALTGRVHRVEPSATTKISALGIEEQRVDVVIALDDTPPGLGDGFRVEVSIQLWHGDDVLTVPAGALFRDRGRWAVYTIAGGRAHLVAVEVGRRGRTVVEVTGVAPGTAVIIHPSDRVRDGA